MSPRGVLGPRGVVEAFSSLPTYTRTLREHAQMIEEIVITYERRHRLDKDYAPNNCCWRAAALVFWLTAEPKVLAYCGSWLLCVECAFPEDASEKTHSFSDSDIRPS